MSRLPCLMSRLPCPGFLRGGRPALPEARVLPDLPLDLPGGHWERSDHVAQADVVGIFEPPSVARCRRPPNVLNSAPLRPLEGAAPPAPLRAAPLRALPLKALTPLRLVLNVAFTLKTFRNVLKRPCEGRGRSST